MYGEKCNKSKLLIIINYTHKILTSSSRLSDAAVTFSAKMVMHINRKKHITHGSHKHIPMYKTRYRNWKIRLLGRYAVLLMLISTERLKDD